MPSDIFADGAALVNDTFHAQGARTVTYMRGEATVSVAATVGRTVFRQDTAAGVRREQVRDYKVSAAALVLNGTAVAPNRGDRIVDDGRVFEVLAPGGEPPWRWCTGQQVRYRIHTREVTRAGQ